LERSDAETIERATAASVAPDEVHELGGFVVAIDGGTLGRALSAAPLSHDLAPDHAVLDAIDALYRDHGYAPVYRIADVPGQAAMQAALQARGLAPDTATLVKIAPVDAMRALAGEPAGRAGAPDEAWTALFLGEGFDPVDGANRIRNLGRAAGTAFAAVREDGVAHAVGAGGFGNGWLSIHGMRTSPARRGEGLAGRVLAGLAAEAGQRGFTRAFLQVMEDNAPARALYRRAGFVKAWRYHYWRPTSPAP
jgi:ribosomal protein S18 acetylase RimI-like enzyme